VAKLVVRQGRNAGAEFVLPAEKNRIVMGRRGANEVQVLDPKSSRDHAEILREGGRLVLRDLKSRNGTFLNDRQVQADVDLEYGDRIRIGDTVFELVDDAANQPITLKLPGYEILERIGQGSMGTVYKARQLSMDRIVALKVLNEKYSKDEAFIQRFIREARAAGKLSHPNVIHVHDVSESGGVHYFTMEFVDGTTVKRMLKREGRISVDKAVDIVLQAAKALQYAHENGIVHRDIKPDNLMLTKEGVVKLADLGIAKTFDESGASSGGQQRRIFGTPHYMAPEQALGKEIDARADIYSLGATFYHMLTGTTPFQGNTVTDVLKAHIQSELPPVQEKAEDVPDAVVYVLEKMMAKSPEKRYATMGRVIEDLEKAKSAREAEIERIAAGESSIMVAAKPAAKKRERERKAGPRGPMPVWAKGLVAVGVVGGLVALFFVTVAVARAFLEPPALGLWKRAEEARLQGRTDEAARLYREIVTGYPRTAEAQMAANALALLPGQEGSEPSGTAPGAGGPEEALARLAELEKKGEYEELASAAGRFPEEHPDAKEEYVARARAFAERAEAALRERKEKEAAAVLAECAKYASENPDDLQGQLDRYRTVGETYPGTAAAEAALRSAKALSDRIDSMKAEAARRDFEEARRRFDDAQRKGDYDAASEAYTTFLAQHDGSREAAEARASLERLEKRLESEFERAKKSAEEHLAGSRFGEARAAVERFAKAYISAKWKAEADKLLEGIDAKIDEAFEKGRAKAEARALAFAHMDAAGEFKILATRFRGTKWEASALARAKELEAERTFHQAFVKRVNASPGRELPFAPPGLPAGMAGKWRVESASESELVIAPIAPGRQEEPKRPIQWGSLPADKVMDLIESYFPNPTQEEHLVLSYMYRERQMEERAQAHLDKAAGH